jgi:putative transposase
MSMKGDEEVADQTRKRAAISGGHGTEVDDPPESRMNTSLPSVLVLPDIQSVADPTPAITPEFITANKVAGLTGDSLTTVKRHCRVGKYPGARKAPIEGNESWQIPVDSLPLSAQKKLAKEIQEQRAARLATIAPSLAAPEGAGEGVETRRLWDAYERSGAVQKRRAEFAHAALNAFHDRLNEGLSISDAEKAVATSHGVSKATLWRYRTATKNQPRCNWLPHLLPRYMGGRPSGEFTPEAYDFILTEFMSTSKPPLTAVIAAARAEAAVRRWVIPGYHAVKARLAKEPRWLTTAGRKGVRALEHSYPAVRRDYNSLALHEVWESDGRKADVFCFWPDGTVARPLIVVWRDVRSRMVLSAKGYMTPKQEIVAESFGLAMERTGTWPDYALIDNGMDYAAKSVTGGQPTRYRNKVKPGDPIGIITRVGTVAKWAPPGRGQAKPIESFWRHLANWCDKAPEFQGAYCGKDVVSKPEDFDRKKAIPIAVYGERLAQVLEDFNTKHQHRGSGMNGRTPIDVYTELAQQTKRQLVDPAHLRLCKMGHALIKPNQRDATYELKIPGQPTTTRYYSEEIASLQHAILARQHSVFYSMERPEQPVSIYDGHTWLGDARPIDPIPFLEEGGERAGEHVRDRHAFMKSRKAALTDLKRAAGSNVPALPDATSTPPLPHIEQVEITGKKPPAVQPERPYIPTKEDEEKLAESRRRAEAKQLLLRIKYA